MQTFSKTLLSALLATFALNVSAQEQPIQPSRVGIEGGTIALDLQSAIRMALEKNQNIEVERANADAARAELLSARGAFDFVVDASPFHRSETLPAASVLAGGSTGTLSQNNTGVTASAGQLLPWGAQYQIGFDSLRSTSSNIFVQLNPQFSTGLNLRFVQPLARSFNNSDARRLLRLRNRAVDISETQFQRLVMDVVTSVQQAFWNLAGAREQVGVLREAMELAAEQRGITERQVKAGTLAKIEITASEAEFQRRQEQYLAGLEAVTAAENELKQLLADNRKAAIWAQEIVPQKLEMPVIQVPSIDGAVVSALEKRPEVRALQLQIEQNQIDIDFLRNQLLPQIDLVASYGKHGLAGTPRVGGGSPFGNQPPPAFFTGGYNDSLAMLFNRDFRTAEVGLVLSFPLQNRRARGEHAEAKAGERRLTAARQILEQQVEAQVRNAIQGVLTTQQRAEAARAARVASEEKLASESRLFRVGESTNFLVLTRQNEYSAARAAEVRALADLRRALAAMERAVGTVLETQGVTIEQIRK